MGNAGISDTQNRDIDALADGCFSTALQVRLPKPSNAMMTSQATLYAPIHHPPHQSFFPPSTPSSSFPCPEGPSTHLSASLALCISSSVSLTHLGCQKIQKYLPTLREAPTAFFDELESNVAHSQLAEYVSVPQKYG
jgi:hypothetical protein